MSPKETLNRCSGFRFLAVSDSGLNESRPTLTSTTPTPTPTLTTQNAAVQTISFRFKMTLITNYNR